MTSWIAPEPAPVDGPTVGPDRAMLEGYLGYQRYSLRNICAGLSAEQLAARPLPSTNLTLLGMLRHLAKVERIWLRIRVGREPIEPLFAAELGKDYDFEHIDAAEAESAYATYLEECRLGDLAAANASFDDIVEWRLGTWSVRMVYVHMIAEYARHNGHADLLRQAIDGVHGR